MSQTIDSKVVEMKFDNQQFENNVKNTMSTLDKLKSMLKFEGAQTGLLNVSKATNNINFNPVSDAVQTVQNKFSAFEVMAITAIANITNSVVNLGKQMARSLTIEPIYQGFGEYELKMNSVQTIMASTGEDIQTVNKYLDELNTYADRTIYSFSDMTASIGKFTNAGVDLDSAVKAIQGISNEAAVSGANANEASRAMYNFAQALSSGAVKLIDWKSIENANMATVEFKQQLLDTALALGTVVKEGDEYVTTTTDLQGKVSQAFTATHAFNDSLAHQWMTTDVLVQTLSNYSTDIREMSKEERKAYREKLASIGYTEEQIEDIEKLGQKAFDSAQDVKTFTQLIDTLKEAAGSGWAQTFEILFGDLEEAKKLWTGVSQVVGGYIDKSSDARNNMLKEWDALGGRTYLIDAAKNAFDGMLSVVKPIGEAFRDVFPPMTARNLANITWQIKEFTKGLRLSDESMKNLHDTFRGVFSIFDIAGQAAKALLQAVFPALSGLDDIGAGILGFTGSLGRNIAAFDEWLKENEFFTNAVSKTRSIVEPAFEKIGSGAKTAVDAIKEFGKTHFKKPDFSWLRELGDKARTRMSLFQKLGEIVRLSFGKIGEALKAVAPIASRIGGILLDTIEKLADGILKALHGEGFDSLLDLLNGGMMVGIGVGISKFIQNLTRLETALGDMFEGKAGIGGLIGKIKGVFGQLQDSLQALTHNTKYDQVKKLATAIAILAGSLLVLSLIDSDKLGGALASISILMTEMTGVMAIFDRFSGKGTKGLNTAAGGLIKMSVSILILAAALKKISDIKSEDLWRSLGAISALIAEMTGVMLLMSNFGGKAKIGGLNMVLFAASIAILASVMKKLSDLDGEQIKRSLLAMGGAMAEMVAAMKLLGGTKTMHTAASMLLFAAAMTVLAAAFKIMSSLSLEQITNAIIGFGLALGEITAVFKILEKSKTMSTALSMIAFAAAMVILAAAFKSMASLSLDQIANAAIAFGLALGEIVAAFKILDGAKTVSTAMAMLVMAAAMNVMAVALKSMGGMKLEDIGKSLLVFGGAMAIIVAAFRLLKPASVLKTAVAMTIMGAAMNIMAVALKSMGGMSWGEIAAALVVLAGAFTVLGAAAGIFKALNLVPTLLGLSTALVLLGIAAAGVGAGILMLSIGLASLAVSGVAGVTALVAALEILITGVLDIIARSAKSLAGAVKAIVLSLVDVIVSCAPALAEGALTVVEEIAKSLVDHGPTIVGYIMEFLLGVVKEIRARLPELVAEGVLLVADFFQGVFDGFSQIDTTNLEKVLKGAGILTSIMIALAFLASLVPAAMTGVIGLGVLMLELTGVFAAIGAIAQIPGIEWLVEQGGEFGEKLGTAVGKLVGGVIGGIAEGATSTLPQIGTSLSDFMTNMQPFFDGLKGVDPSSFDAVSNLAGALMKITGANLLEGIASWVTGKSSIEQFAESLPPLAEGLTAFSENLGDSLGDSSKIEAAGNLASMLAALASNEIPKTGGVLQWLTGESNISGFADSLPDLAKGLSTFAENLGDDLTNTEKINAAHNLASMLAALASNEIPKTGGVLQWLKGESNVAGFGDQLPNLAKGLSEFSSNLNDDLANADKINAATNLAKMLAALSNESIPDSGGVLQWFAGHPDLTAFGEQLPELAKGLSSFADNLGDGLSNTDKLQSALDVAKILSDLQTSLQGTDLGGIFTEGSLEKFSQQMTEFGTGLSNFSDNIKGVDSGKMTSVVDSVNVLKTMLADLGEIDTSKADAFIQSLEKLASIDISGFANSMSSVEGSAGQAATAASNFMQSFAEGLNSNANIAIDKASSIAEQVGVALSSNTTEANQSGQALAQAFADGFSNSATDISGSAGDMAQKGVSGISKKRKAFADAGKSLATQLSTGFGSGASTLSTKAGSAAANAAAHVRVQNGAFYSAGAYICAGLANGINAGRSGVIQAAINVAVAAINAAKARLAVKSPSRVFFEIGSFVVQGFTNAMYEGGQRIQNAAVYMADNAINGMNNAVEKIANAVDHALDGVDPVITPVVDLAGVQASADRIDGMFGLQRPIDISGTINANMMAARESRTTDKDLLSAIKSIGRSKGDTNTFNITVDGAENPEDFADRLLRRMKIRTRTANG